MLEDDDTDVQLKAAEGLGELGDITEIGPLGKKWPYTVNPLRGKIPEAIVAILKRIEHSR